MVSGCMRDCHCVRRICVHNTVSWCLCLLLSSHEQVAQEVREFLGLPEDPAASLKELMNELQEEVQKQSDFDESEVKSSEEKKTD